MNTKAILPVAVALLVLGFTRPSIALEPPSIEPIVVTLSATPPGNVFEAFYPNEFDLIHVKELTFLGAITNANQELPAFVDLWFDWIDPRDPTHPQTSPVFPIDLGPLQTNNYGAAGALPPIKYTIPFCPPQVSIHIQNNGPGQPVVIDGQFIHQCVPEPGTLALFAIGSVGLLALAKRRV